MKLKSNKPLAKLALQENGSKKDQQALFRQKKPKYIKQIIIDGKNQLDKVNPEFDKYVFKVFDRETLQECSKRGGYFDNKIVSFEKPYGEQLKKDCIIISKFIHSKCLKVKQLQVILPELDIHHNQQIDVDDETIQKLFTSIQEVSTSGKLEHLELDFKSWKKCTEASIKNIADCLYSVFQQSPHLTHFSINLNNWKDVTDIGACQLSESLQMKTNFKSLIHLNLSLEGWNQCTSIASEKLINSLIELSEKAQNLETFKFSLWNWGKCNDKSCELISQLMQTLSDECKKLQQIDFNFFGWTKCTDQGLQDLCMGVTSLFQSLNGILNFNLNISGWRGITQRGINLISNTFKDCLFNLQPYLVDANITFSKSDKVLTICSKYLRARFMARMQFMAFYKFLEWQVNSPTQVSQDLYIDTLNQMKEPQQEKVKEIENSKVQLKAQVKMPAYIKNQEQKNNQKPQLKNMKF
ncbi:hypothetical protein TTHERM_00681820 (macronuclear) [Tetrahymena thermophila SB210]|uniref:Kinase domain protein n=1 Tax=Tetrahymena thermophila (strain SB210) TaxID=312017 RepID=I7MMW1_TETTS|nr:hypothetical protein TTHERM_00681820 [Tetrahymena thermophila SB210]EAS07075.2 hypothetical protein TTHERM_00681820 [Tetrahymena thermophila SB210]|eukprot:XP_001027317.2 hypothetical protein TTHERM_00681820 [Tetrahymena thermophila SB210]